MSEAKSTYRIVSNITEIATCVGLKAAKALAIEESLRFDDIITIELEGAQLYMISGGQLFRLTRTK